MQQESAKNPSPQKLSDAFDSAGQNSSEQRVRYIEHDGKRILLADITACKPDQMLECIRLVPAHVTREPEHSVLLLADFTGAEFTRESIEKLKIAAAYDQPHIAKAAWVLSDNLPKVFIESIRTFSARDIAVFSTREEALEYLIA